MNKTRLAASPWRGQTYQTRFAAFPDVGTVRHVTNRLARYDFLLVFCNDLWSRWNCCRVKNRQRSRPSPRNIHIQQLSLDATRLKHPTERRQDSVVKGRGVCRSGSGWSGRAEYATLLCVRRHGEHGQSHGEYRRRYASNMTNAAIYSHQLSPFDKPSHR